MMGRSKNGRDYILTKGKINQQSVKSIPILQCSCLLINHLSDNNVGDHTLQNPFFYKQNFKVIKKKKAVFSANETLPNQRDHNLRLNQNHHQPILKHHFNFQFHR